MRDRIIDDVLKTIRNYFGMGVQAPPGFFTLMRVLNPYRRRIFYRLAAAVVRRLMRGGEERKTRTGVPFAQLLRVVAESAEQQMTVELLLDDRVPLVTLVGQAGTGKTLLALAAALQKVVEEQVYEKILVSRPIMPLGRDIGYLPGSKEEKLREWMNPIFDNLKFLLTLKRIDKGTGLDKMINALLENGVIELEALTYIRGRSIPRQFIIVDEAQNLTPHEVKTIISRVGEKSKMVMTGDAYQIDNPYLDSSSNGLTYAAERMKDQELVGHVVLSKSERSMLASLAAEML